MRNITVRGLISFAYFARPYEVVDGPDWIDRSRFDVVAVAQGRSVRDNYTMVQSLLADRLSLRLRTEMREMPVYVLRGSLRAVAMQWSTVMVVEHVQLPSED